MHLNTVAVDLGCGKANTFRAMLYGGERGLWRLSGGDDTKAIKMESPAAWKWVRSLFSCLRPEQHFTEPPRDT